jgi:hypothetical protein
MVWLAISPVLVFWKAVNSLLGSASATRIRQRCRVWLAFGVLMNIGPSDWLGAKEMIDNGGWTSENQN